MSGRDRDHGNNSNGRLIVLDLTQFLAGPFCTQILGDLGARVVKVESAHGDLTRDLPPHFVAGSSAYFISANRNKESVVIDLKHPQGRDLLLRLARVADVVVENSRPDVMERLGLSWDDIRAVNPQIVMCRIRGFGSHGPDRDRAAYDIVIQAVSGVMSVTGEPGRPPVRTGVPLADVAAGLYAAIGVLDAVRERLLTGRGRCIDVSMLDCQLALLSYVAQYYLISGEEPGPQGRGHMSIPTYRSFTCGDGRELVVAAISQRMWRDLCVAVELEHLIDDPRFATGVDRLEHREALWALLEPAFASRNAADMLVCLREADVPSAVVNTVGEALEEAQVVANGLVATMETPDRQQVKTVGNPIRTVGETPGPYAWPPALGGGTYAVLRDLLGMASEEIDALAAAGAIPVSDSVGRAHRPESGVEGHGGTSLQAEPRK